jgi:hypothetical protein
MCGLNGKLICCYRTQLLPDDVVLLQLKAPWKRPTHSFYECADDGLCFNALNFDGESQSRDQSRLIKESGVRYKSIPSSFCQVACQFVHVCYRIRNSTYPSYFLILLTTPSSADIISAKGAPVSFLCDLACTCALLALGR